MWSFILVIGLHNFINKVLIGLNWWFLNDVLLCFRSSKRNLFRMCFCLFQGHCLQSQETFGVTQPWSLGVQHQDVIFPATSPMSFLPLCLFFDSVTIVVKTLIIVQVLYLNNLVLLSHHQCSICFINNRKLILKINHLFSNFITVFLIVLEVAEQDPSLSHFHYKYIISIIIKK